MAVLVWPWREMGQSPKTEEAQAISDEVYAQFVGEEVDKVELVYSRFISLILAEPSVQTILPLSKEGELCDVNGECVDAASDVLYTLTSTVGPTSHSRPGPRTPAHTRSRRVSGSHPITSATPATPITVSPSRQPLPLLGFTLGLALELSHDLTTCHNLCVFPKMSPRATTRPGAATRYSCVFPTSISPPAAAFASSPKYSPTTSSLLTTPSMIQYPLDLTT